MNNVKRNHRNLGWPFSVKNAETRLILMPPGPESSLQSPCVVREYQKELVSEQNGPEQNGQCSRRDKNSDACSPEDVVLLISQTENSSSPIPAEKLKTLLAFLFAWSALLLNVISLSFIHDRVPDRTKVGPLPDIVFDLFPPQDWALDVSEVIIIASMCAVLILFVVHKHRFILMRRVFLMMGILYLMRSVTMFVTQLPVASETYYCSPQKNQTTPDVIVKRVLHLSAGFGLSINGKHTFCGDYIYSGHTITLTMAYLVIKQYAPDGLHLISWLSWVASASGIIMIIISRGHYTIDVILAYYVSTRVFWMYHVLASNSSLKCRRRGNPLSSLWWFTIFLYMETNVPEQLDNKFEWPFPWPKRKHPSRVS